MTIGYEGHASHSQYVIRIAGFAPREIELTAQIVRHHRKATATSRACARRASCARAARSRCA
jgi:exopolyphosphatase/pppGpp-phosphohydrolase